MKKLFLMALMAFIATTASFAQWSVGSITVQPKIGINGANITDADNSDSRIGLVLGGEFEYRVSPIFSLSAGALYSMQGCKGTAEDEDGNTGDVSLKLDYINVPILANVYVVKGLAIKLGIQPGFNVRHKATATVSGVNVTTNLPGVKSVDFSIPIGVSYEFNRFVIDGRYNLGVTKLIDGADSKHSVFQFTFGYKFSLYP
uniref:porin family protein n=1 Tax=Prevotella sp. TaxID=59823 RepID=UPI003FEE2693